MASCLACGASQLEHDDDTGSQVCTSCGTLTNPLNVVLADHGFIPFNSAYSATRTHRGRHLAQTKRDRDRRNAIAMSTFINTVLSRLNNPGLSPRAEAIFTQAMSKGSYRWGRRAKLTAGASISIALREARKSDSLHDIACFLDESPVSLSRAFRSVVSLLDFSLATTDPTAHLHILHAHLLSVIHSESSQLPKPLPSLLTAISLPAAVRIASDLSHIVSHHSPPLAIASLPTPPTACALFILGLEAEARTPLPHVGQLTRTLATRFSLAQGVVSSRYKVLYDLIEEWIRHVPWLDQFACKPKGGTSRSKVPKRTIVAKGIKDVVQFHQEINQSRIQKVNLDLELESSDFEDEDEGDNGNVSTPKVDQFDIRPPRPGKLRKDRAEEKQKQKQKQKQNTTALDDDAMQAAYRFLIDPLSSSARAIDAATSSNGEVGDVSLLTHILTCSPDQLSRGRGVPTPLTRLQQLAASRGGSTAAHIADEELFTEGELEGALRDEREREALGPLFQLNWGENESNEKVSTGEESASAAAVTRRRTRAVAEPKRGAKRVDMDALARVLGGYGDNVSPNDDDDAREDAWSPDVYGDDDAYLCEPEDNELCFASRDRISAGGAEELASDWRCPDDDDEGDDNMIGAFHNTAEERYEQEL